MLSDKYKFSGNYLNDDPWQEYAISALKTKERKEVIQVRLTEENHKLHDCKIFDDYPESGGQLVLIRSFE
jgi:hypothetical protein